MGRINHGGEDSRSRKEHDYGIFHAAEVGSHGIDNYKFNIKWSIYS
jgi:hypothetical protein